MLAYVLRHLVSSNITSIMLEMASVSHLTLGFKREQIHRIFVEQNKSWSSTDVNVIETLINPRCICATPVFSFMTGGFVVDE